MEPTGASMILGLRLRQMRESRKLKAREVVERFLNCSTSKLFMIELGERSIGSLELAGLVGTAYNRQDMVPRMEELRQQVANGDAGPVQDRPTLHPHVMLVHELEKEAIAAYGLQIDQVPKLWQSKPYMIAQHTMAGHTDEEIERLTLAGMARQETFLAIPNPPLTTVIITESALDRAAYVPGQLEFMHERAQHHSLRLRIILTAKGPHPSYAGFTVMKFEGFPDTLWTDSVSGGSLIHNSEEIEQAQTRWDRLAEHFTTTPKESIDILATRL